MSVVFRSFVKELHQQLMTCMNYFVDKLQKYQKYQAEKINRRDETLQKEMKDAQQLVDDIELLMRSPASVSVGGREIINRCELFFENCVDTSQCEADFSYLDFVPSGRLYVKNEHLGYFRLCDAMPEDVELKLGSNDPAVCNQESTVVIQTNQSRCTDAEPYLDVHLSDDRGASVPFKIVNNNNGSYSVVFVPSRPGMHQLNVQLFGNTVSSSPLEIVVAHEVVPPKHTMSDPRAANVNCSNNLVLSTSSGHRSVMLVDYSQDNLSGSPAKKPAVPLVKNYDDGEYVASPPHAAVKASPVSAVSLIQEVPSPLDRDDFEEVRGSLMRMNVDSATVNGKRSLPASGVGASSAECNTLPSYTCGVLEFDDLTSEPDMELDSSGVNLQLSYLL